MGTNGHPASSVLPDTLNKRLLREAIALLLPIIALLVQSAFWASIRPFVWFLFYPAVFASTWIGSLRSGLAASVLAALLGWWFFVSPEHSTVEDGVGLRSTVVFLGMGCLFAIVRERLRNARKRAEDAAVELTRAGESSRAQEMLRRAAAFDEAVLKCLGEGVYTIDEKGLVTSMNPAAEELFGWTLAELRGKKMHDMTHHHHPDGRPFPSSECAGFQVLMHGWPLKNHEDVFIRKDGSFFDVTYSIAPLRDAGGAITGLVVVFSDVTDRKRAEESIRAHKEWLELAQAAAAIGSFEWNIPTGENRWSKELEALYGLEAGQFDGTLDGWAKRLHPEDREQTLRASVRSAQTGADFDREFRVVLPDGTVRWLHGRCTVLRDAAGQPLRMIGVNVDVTARKEHEFALQRAIQTRDEVLGVVAHDLRNPLASIFMQTALLRRPGPEPERRSQKPMEVIERSANRMARLIQDLLDLTAMEAGHLSIELDRTPAGALVADAMEAQADLANSTCLDLRLDIVDDLPEVYADRERLLQVFENLIGNAAKFTECPGHITVGARPRDGQVLFWVADTGAGIAAEVLPHVFDRFWQGQRADRRGTGLGLPIVKGIVEAHGGRVWAESMPGRGSTFLFTIPMAPRVEARLEPAPQVH